MEWNFKSETHIQTLMKNISVVQHMEHKVTNSTDFHSNINVFGI